MRDWCRQRERESWTGIVNWRESWAAVALGGADGGDGGGADGSDEGGGGGGDRGGEDGSGVRAGF